MERLFLSFHSRKTLPRPGETLFMGGMAGLQGDSYGC